MRRWIGGAAFGLCVMGWAVPAAAQTPAVEASVGYQLLRVEEENFTRGWYLDVTGNVSSVIGIVGQVGGNYESQDTFIGTVDASVHEFMFGLRANARSRPAVLYAQVLGGGIRGTASAFGSSDSTTEMALQAGVGVNLMATRGFGVRIGADYLRIFEEGGGTNVLRINAGLAFGFGG